MLDRKNEVFSCIPAFASQKKKESSKKKKHSFKTVQHVLANLAIIFLADSMNDYVCLLSVLSTKKIARHEVTSKTARNEVDFKTWLVKRPTPNNFYELMQRLLWTSVDLHA